MGKTLAATLGGSEKDLIVSGVAENPPSNSSIQFEVILNIENMKYLRGDDFLTYWTSFSTHLFLLLDDQASVGELERKLQGFADQYLMQNVDLDELRERGQLGPDGRSLRMSLENIEKIHFSPGVSGGLTVGSNGIGSLYVLSGIALIIMVLVCFNFMNISLAGASHREVEIGIRKILGAGRKQMTSQFFVETATYLFFGMVLGLFFSSVMIGPFNHIMDKQLVLRSIFTGKNILVLVLMVAVVGVFAAVLPGSVFSKLRPSLIFSGKLKAGKKGTFRKIPVVVQFAGSFFLLVCMMTMMRQILYLRSQNIGFDNENLIIIETLERRSEESESMVVRYKEAISHNPGILSVTGSGSSFYRITYGGGGIVNGNRIQSANSNRVHYDFVQTLGLRLIEGRDFSPEYSTDDRAAIVNETLIKQMQIDEPLDTVIKNGGDIMPDFHIIGVVNDSKLASLEDEIKPLFLHMFPGIERVPLPLHYIFVRISGTDVLKTRQYLEDNWKDLFPNKPFQCVFADEDIERSLGEFKKWMDIVKYAGILAVLVTGIGLFCLTSLMVSTRIKEIGIRKVLGASILQIFRSVTSEFLLLVLIGCAAALPAGFYFMNRWLQNYAHRVSISWLEFSAAAMICFFVSLATVSYQALKTAYSNPVAALRHE